MKPTLSQVLTLLAVACLGCGDDAVDPGEQLINGLEVTASVTPIAGGISAFQTGMILSVAVQLRNTTATAIQRHIPVGCAVRIRLYQPGNDNLLYDQTVFPCDVDATVPLSIEAGETKTLNSGSTFPYVIQADSVPAGFYNAVAVLRITGENPIEIEAGQYRLPNCPTPSTCVFRGPPATIDPERKQ